VPARPEKVLELMHSALQRYETVRAAPRHRGDGPTLTGRRERFRRSEAHRRMFGEPDLSKPVSDPEPDVPFEWCCRVWRVDEHRWRQETELPGGGVDIWASTGSIRTHKTPQGPPGSSEQWHLRVGGGRRADNPVWLIPTADTFWTMYPFDPADFASIDGELERLDLEVEGPMLWAGREALRLKGVPVEEWECPPEPLWWGPTSTRRSWT
jgi:hypothetical protein